MDNQKEPVHHENLETNQDRNPDSVCVREKSTVQTPYTELYPEQNNHDTQHLGRDPNKDHLERLREQ
jgi:hypothetical protein